MAWLGCFAISRPRKWAIIRVIVRVSGKLGQCSYGVLSPKSWSGQCRYQMQHVHWDLRKVKSEGRIAIGRAATKLLPPAVVHRKLIPRIRREQLMDLAQSFSQCRRSQQRIVALPQL